MAVNNFEQIKGLLKFDSPNDFYFVQVIQRKKDHKEENKRLGRNNNARLIKAYYVYSVEQLEEYTSEMIALAQMFNARVGINLNRRNNKQVAFEMNEHLAACLKSENYNLSKLYNSVCGMVTGKDKLWLLDIDRNQVTRDNMRTEPYGTTGISERVRKTLETLEPIGGDKIVAEIPTKNGVHLITTVFNSKKFSELHPDVEIHKNNPTVLYIP